MNQSDLDDILAAHAIWTTEGGPGCADLRDANLSGANLNRADLRGSIGLILLTQTDHGYHVLATRCGDRWRIRAGCRDFTIAEARAHWGAADYPLPSSGSRIVAMLDWLAEQPTPQVEVAK